MEDASDVTAAAAVLERLKRVVHDIPAGVIVAAALFVVVVVRYIYPLFFNYPFNISSSSKN